MTIRFACDCGRQLTAPEEYTGKRVKCSACGEIQTVPAAARRTTPAAAPPPLADGVIRFRCDCGQACQVRSEHAGKNIRCPKCATVLTAPGRIVDDEEEEDRSPRRAAAIQADKPLPRSGRRPARDEDDEDEDYDEERPGKRKKGKKQSRLWIWLSASAALLLIAGGVTWWLLSSGVSGDFDLVPRDAQGFATVRVADTIKTPLGKKLMDRLGQMDLPVKEIEEKTSLKLEDIERATVVVADAQKEGIWVIVQTTKSYDKDKILNATPAKPKEDTHAGKKFYKSGRGEALYFHSDRVMVFGSEKGVKQCMDQPKKPKSGPLDDALKAASKGKNVIAGGMNVPPDLVKLARLQLKNPAAAGVVAAVEPLLDTRTAHFTAAIKDDLDVEIVLGYADKDKAKKAESAINDLLGIARIGLAAAKGLVQQQGLGKDGDQIMKQAEETLNTLKPKQSGKTVSLAWKQSGDTLIKSLDLPLKQRGGRVGGAGRPPAFGPVDRVRGAAAAATALNNFKQLTLAFYNYNDVMGHIPQPAIMSQNGQPLLSWRVAILPYIEQDALYRQFHLNEPWNSAHNRTLLSKMPKTFEIPGAVAGPGQTFIQVFTGKNTPFPGGMQKLRIPASFSDGTSNTILLAEAARPVNWTAPDDMKLDVTPPTFLVGNHTGRGTLVSLGDGSVRTVPQTVSVQTWKAAISPAGGEVLGADWGRP